MARVYRVQKAAKPHVCEKGHPIEKGDAYYWAKPGFRGRKRYRCGMHPFRPSELATGLNATPMAAQEDAEDALDQLEPHDYDGLAAIVEEFRSALEDYVAEREQGLEQWENGNSTLEDLLDQAQQALDSFDPSEPEEFDEEEPDADEDEEAWDQWDADRSQHWEDQVENVREAVSGVDL